MKKIMQILFITLAVLSLSSCTPTPSSKSGSSSSSEDTAEDTTVSGGTGSTSPTGNSGGNCTGTTSDGQGSGYAIHQYDMLLAGHQPWVPGTYSDELAQSTMPTIEEAGYVFRSDSKLKVRLKINSQPYPTSGETYCYGRETGKASDPYQYTKLRFRIHLRDIKCDTPDSSDPNKCSSGFYLGNRYRTTYIDPVAVDSCSNVIDVGAIRNQTQYGTVVEVEDVKSDSTCQYNGSFCPAEKIVRAASCWHMTMQIVTDYTQDFK